jgi:hypothetical protein
MRTLPSGIKDEAIQPYCNVISQLFKVVKDTCVYVISEVVPPKKCALLF